MCFKCQVCFGHNDVFKSDCFKMLIFKVKNLNIKFNLPILKSFYCFNLIILKFYLGSIGIKIMNAFYLLCVNKIRMKC